MFSLRGSHLALPLQSKGVKTLLYEEFFNCVLLREISAKQNNNLYINLIQNIPYVVN